MEENHMESGEEKQHPRCPSVDDIESLIRDATNKSNQVVFTSKQDQQWNLSNGQPTSSDPHRRMVLGPWNVSVHEFEQEHPGQVSDY
jgi:hypothetical protein